MIDSFIRDKVQSVFDLLGRTLVTSRIRANWITGMAFITGLLAAFFIPANRPVVALVLLWLSGLLDVLDGTVARLSGTSSSRGAFMDLIFDRMVEAAVILGFAVLFPQYYLAFILFLIAVIFNFSTFMLAGSLFKNSGPKSMHYDAGIAERTETFLVFSLMLLLPDYLFHILMAFNMLIFLTGIIRFAKVLKHAGDGKVV